MNRQHKTLQPEFFREYIETTRPVTKRKARTPAGDLVVYFAPADSNETSSK